ncbi:GFA family protein [Pseudomonas stutzeri]|uniref:Alanine acetyltransferase n=1 Tax=Stutzerimonas stutzeri TaxID=316 RepID=A0A2N8S262_STUST|nr:GFA family protein [Stutzerimonas stutzeri]MCQ4295862.1 GFA family protein [Stutzerimonas stutzeri]PNF80694.1 alanine acetyltransferase [Stutzerimonas stutzeri]
MKLEGSCHCQAVRFSLECAQPYPFMRCYCSICRKTAGGGGYAINLGGDYRTLQVEGREHVSVYQARLTDSETGEVSISEGRRHFCAVCASALWLWDPNWPDLMHPFASAIDTELPVPPEHTHLMLGSKASWVEPQVQEHDRCFSEYPDESLAQWHQRLGLNGS